MKILYICSQRPGVGGASTETYEAIKRLRDLEHQVTGLFIIGNNREAKMCDPDSIGGIQTCHWRQRDDPKLLVGDYDIIVGKNYEAPWVARKRTDIPTVYLTSGIDFISHFHMPAIDVEEILPADGVDVRAFQSVSSVIVHSTLDMSIYRKRLPISLLRKIVGDVVYTPNIAVVKERVVCSPLLERKWDICFSSSTWKRVMKNGPLMSAICQKLARRYKIVVCGEDFLMNEVTCLGLVSHHEMMKIMAQSRVVAIPSLYDPSPNLYPEAIFSGCNVICSPNVGNVTYHPKALMSPDLNLNNFIRAIEEGLQLEEQVRYTALTPENAAKQLEERLQQIINIFALRNKGMHKPYDPNACIQIASPPKRKLQCRKTPAIPPLAPLKIGIKTISVPLSGFAQNMSKKEIRDYVNRILRCPQCFGAIKLKNDRYTCTGCGTVYIEKAGVIEFEPDDSHVGSFSEQWDRHSRVQVDSHGYKCGYNGFHDSKDTFWKKTGLQANTLKNCIVLDAGCGVGRFSEVAGDYAACVIPVDLSHAVFHASVLMNERNMANGPCLKANLERIPLADESVDVAFSLGVMHHSPNPINILKELIRVTRKEGVVAGWVYQKQNSYGTSEREQFRQFTTDPKNYKWVKQFSELAPILRSFAKKGAWDQLREVLGISGSDNDAECVCDTFDWLTPKYQYQYTVEEFHKILTDLGLVEIDMLPFPVSFKARKA